MGVAVVESGLYGLAYPWNSVEKVVSGCVWRKSLAWYNYAEDVEAILVCLAMPGRDDSQFHTE